ncbi:MAG TPA: hypothetical protein VGN86_02870, partial [Pyrinomonadaceae bacterium]|nr:hypothetical protein [Pyrinomonadaceae bacterium]
MNNGREHKGLGIKNGSWPIFGSAPASLACLHLVLVLLILLLAVKVGIGQVPSPELKQANEAPARFRVECTVIPGGGELLTIWARAAAPSESGDAQNQSQADRDEIPLLSVLRDTLGDENRENDILREVWVHTYTRPKLIQQAVAFVPFLYKGLHPEPNAKQSGAPRAIINLSETDQSALRRVFLSGVTRALIDQTLVKSSVHNYQRNVEDYRKANLMRALTILSLYGSERAEDSPLSEAELVQMQSQIALTEKTFGGLVDKVQLSGFHEKETSNLRDTRGHNWELLRQQAENSGLYFQPLSLSDTTVTHALLWFPVTASTNREANANHRFEGRFLNIKNPWRDQRLQRWEGFTETKFFDGDNREVSHVSATSRDPNTQAVTMIPLAVYGLDFNKIPALLIDFRDTDNPRRRELSGKLINDITRDVLSISRFGNIYYFLGRSAFDFVTSKRGLDINQPSRIRSAAELKLLLSLDSKIDNGLRVQLEKGLERLSTNPLETSTKFDRNLAVAQYQSLQAYAVRPDGLAVRLERERSSEAAKLVHHGFSAQMFRLANVVTLGHYTHREKITPDLRERLDKQRQLAYHVRLLREVAKSSPVVEVKWKIEKVLPSLRFVAENGSATDKEAAKAVGSIFSRTEDMVAKELCLAALKRIGNKVAMSEMARIYNDTSV